MVETNVSMEALKELYKAPGTWEELAIHQGFLASCASGFGGTIEIQRFILDVVRRCQLKLVFKQLSSEQTSSVSRCFGECSGEC